MAEVVVSAPVDGVVMLTLNRPEKKNALSVEVRDLVSDELDRLADDVAVRAVVVTGEGSTFSAGFDLAEFQNDDPAFVERLWASSDRFHRRCLDFPLPLVAAVNGPAIAGGFDLAVMCDLRVASQRAWFSHPELAFSEVVYGPLHELVGGAVARELALTGRRVEADEAERLGLVSRVVADADLQEASLSLAASIAQAPRAVLLRMKQKIIARAGVVGESTLDL
jgi:enoyl-CoA hydratase